ncbi:MAG: S1 RNA-binding domain-containing protein [Bacillota bacterium]
MKKGDIVKGTITAIKPYGAFVKIDEETLGMIHISEISHKFVSDVEDYLNEGETYDFKVLSFEDDGKVNLGMKKKKQRKKRLDIHLKDGFKPLEQSLDTWIETYEYTPFEETKEKKEE